MNERTIGKEYGFRFEFGAFFSTQKTSFMLVAQLDGHDGIKITGINFVQGVGLLLNDVSEHFLLGSVATCDLLADGSDAFTDSGHVLTQRVT